MAPPTAKKPADVNKSAEIRKIATGMKAKGEKPRPSVIVVELKKLGITVAPPQVSNILKKMGFRPLRKRKGASKAKVGLAAAKATSAKSGAKKTSIVSVEDLLAAKKAAGTIGGTDKAIAALHALKRFEG
jgi:arginine repressor